MLEALAESKLLPITESEQLCLESVIQHLLKNITSRPGVFYSKPRYGSEPGNHGMGLPSAGSFWYLLRICHTNSHSDHGLLENKCVPFTSGHLRQWIPGSLVIKQCFQIQVQSQGPWGQMLAYYLLVKRLGHATQ